MFPIAGEPRAVAWGDAAWANVVEGRSTGCSIVGLTEHVLVSGGSLAPVHILSWSSHKLRRKSRSSNAVCEDQLRWVRLMILELDGFKLETREQDRMAQFLLATLVLTATLCMTGCRA